MEDSSSVQYCTSSSGSHHRNTPPEHPLLGTLRDAAAFDTTTSAPPPANFFHHPYQPFDTMTTHQSPPPSTSTTTTTLFYTPPASYDFAAANLVPSSRYHPHFKYPPSSSSSLINIAACYEDNIVASTLPRFIQDNNREMDYTSSGNAAMFHNSSFHGGYNVGGGGGVVNHHYEGLSLSLASQSEVNVAAHHFGEGYSDGQYSSSSGLYLEQSKDDHHGMKKVTSSDHKPVLVGGGGHQGASYVVRTTMTTTMGVGVGPLGPFTGYATILKSSRFLKPAQDILEEWCSLVTAGGGSSSKSGIMEVGDNVASDSAGSAGAMSSSSTAIYGSMNDRAGAGSQTCRPEFHEVKARLLYLLEEVCKRYKQYHQQMQMVVSSFESVAGLSSSTPYVSLAIKTVTRNFKSMKHVISNQLKQAAAKSVTGGGGEEEFFSSSSSSTPSSRLRSYMGGRLERQSCGGPNHRVAFLEPQHQHQQQQHVWRTQRGLPERSVAILRAWLFEHFLHPYPTDADKHMLATQTGLTRNQVSNWFINARVRVWKPMVEEIHMLENKVQAETSQSKGSNNASDAAVVSNSAAIMGPASFDEQVHHHHSQHAHWKQEKRSRVDFQVPAASMNHNRGTSQMNYLPYHGSNGGTGSVSLTLGLRHGVVDNVAHQQQLQRHEDQLRRQFGSGMMHDFVG